MTLTQTITTCYENLKKNFLKISLASLLTILPSNLYAQTFSGQVFINTSKTSTPEFRPSTNIEMKLCSDNDEKTITLDKAGFFREKINKEHKPATIHIKNHDTFESEHEFTFTFDKYDLERKSDVTQFIFLYPQQHWNEGNLWFTLTSRTKIDSSKEHVILVPGFHNVNKEFGNMQYHLFARIPNNYFEFNYPGDQDTRLSSWLLDNAFYFLTGNKKDKKINIIGHSMGNLVTRALIQNKALFQKHFNTYIQDNIIVPYKDNIEIFIMLAPPNFGSYQAYRIVFEQGYKTLERFIRGFNPNAPAYKQLALGSVFLWDINQNFEFFKQKYAEINTHIIAGNNSNLLLALEAALPETKLDQGDGFVSLLSTRLPGIPMYVVDHNHATIAGKTRSGNPLDEKKYNDVLVCIEKLIRKNKLDKRTRDEHGIILCDGSSLNSAIMLKTDKFYNLALVQKQSIDETSYILTEDSGKTMSLDKHTINTNPNIYSEIPVQLDPNSKDIVYFAFYREFFKEGFEKTNKPLFGLKPGEYRIAIVEKDRSWSKTLKFWSDEDEFTYTIRLSPNGIKLEPGQFHMHELTIDDIVKFVKPGEVKEEEEKEPKEIVRKEKQKQKQRRKLETIIIHDQIIHPNKMTCGEYAEFLVMKNALSKDTGFYEFLNDNRPYKLSDIEKIDFDDPPGPAIDINHCYVFRNVRFVLVSSSNFFANLEQVPLGLFENAEDLFLNINKSISGNLERVHPNLFKNAEYLNLQCTNISGNLENVHNNLFKNVRCLDLLQTNISGNLEYINTNLFKYAESLIFTRTKVFGNLENVNPNLFKNVKVINLYETQITGDLKSVHPDLFKNAQAIDLSYTNITGNLKDIHPDLFKNAEEISFNNTNVLGDLRDIHPNLFSNAKYVSLCNTKITGPSTGIDPKFKGYIFKD